MTGIGFDSDGHLLEDREKLEKILVNPTYYFSNIDKSLICDIDETYNELVKKSIEEEFFYEGSNYKTIVKCILRDKSKLNNYLTGFEEVDFIKHYIRLLEGFLKYHVISIHDLKSDFVDSFYYIPFLHAAKIDSIKRNLNKAIKILKQEVKKLEQGTEPIVDDKIAYDYSIENNDMAKLSYLNESGILRHLKERNPPIRIAKFLMRFMDFKTENPQTISRYIKICLQEPNNPQYPKNSKDIQNYLAKINFKQ